MARFKVTMFFREGANGWTESWYTSESYDSTSAMTALLDVAMQRMLMLGQGAYVDAVRVSETDRLRAAVTRQLNAMPVTATGYADYPSAAIIGEVRGDDPYKKVYYLRGFPDDWVVKGAAGGDPEVVAGKSLFKDYCSKLNQHEFQFKVTQKGGIIGLGVEIKGFKAGPDNLIVTAPALGAAEGARVSIKKVKAPSSEMGRRVNKTFKVLAVAGDDYTLQTPIAFHPDFARYAGGKAFLKIPDFTTVSQGDLQRPGERRAGRIFFVPRGRRSAKRP
jgi:hypothetical protein